MNFEEVLEKLLAKDPRFSREAYYFVREALDYTQKLIGKAPKSETPRHVSGRQLLEGVRGLALQNYGPMTITVLEAWGIHRCEDFGDIVFNMVESSLLAKTDQDTREDFKGAYSFDDAFRKPFLPSNRLDGKGAKELKSA